MTIMMQRALTMAAAVAAAACASGSAVRAPREPVARETVLLTRWTPPPGQECTVSTVPTAIPAPEEILDTAALGGAGLTAMNDQSPYALLSLHFDSTGASDRIRVIEPELTQEERTVIEAKVRAALRPRSAAPAFGVRLRVDVLPSGATTIRTGRTLRCLPSRLPDPRTVGRTVTSSRTVVGTSGRSTGAGSRRQTVRWQVLVDETGRVVEITRLPGAQVPAEILGSLESSLRVSRWNPGLDDGIPVAMRTEYRSELRNYVTTIP